jgi:hypothetical protein
MDEPDDQDNPVNGVQSADPQHRIIELLLKRRTSVSGEDPLTSTEKDKIRHIIEELKLEHRDLDVAIRGLAQSSYIDEIQLRRMKKRKLYLKDIIARLSSSLIPDMDA